MSTSTGGLVAQPYTRLQKQLSQEIEHGRSKKVIFPEWANGKVLLDVTATRQFMDQWSGSVDDHVREFSIGEMLDDITEQLVALSEIRLQPALKLDPTTGEFVIIVVLNR